jgi:plasmid maintenance system killer protein
MDATEKLRGHLDGLCSMRFKKRWRLVFSVGQRGEAKDVYLDDHSYA